MTSDQKRRLLTLFADCSDHTLTETGHRELQDLLQADAEARRLWFLYQDLELGLKCLTQVPRVPGTFPEESTLFRMSAEKDDIGTASKHDADSSRVSSTTRRRQTIAAVAVFFLSALVIFGVHTERRPSVADRFGESIVDNRVGDFVVESPTHGTKFMLSEQKGKLIAVHFLLKSECPSCLKLTHDYSHPKPLPLLSII